MKIYLGSDQYGFDLKEIVKEYLNTTDIEVIDLNEKPANDFIESSTMVVEKVINNPSAKGILFDATGVGSFISAVKNKGAIVAQVSDERSAYMTREHNNANIITIGSEITGNTLAINIVKAFIDAKYAGGRHQIRVDMLNAMC